MWWLLQKINKTTTVCIPSVSNSQSNSGEWGCWGETLGVTSPTGFMLFWTECIPWCVDSGDTKGFSCSVLPLKTSFGRSATVFHGTLKSMGHTMGGDCSCHGPSEDLLWVCFTECMFSPIRRWHFEGLKKKKKKNLNRTQLTKYKRNGWILKVNSE